MHPLKEIFPNVSTEEGIIICINDVHSAKTQCSILVIEKGIEIRKKDLNLIVAREEGINIGFNEKQFEKAHFPILVTEEGIDICANLEQLANALIKITEEGIMISVNELHSEKA